MIQLSGFKIDLTGFKDFKSLVDHLKNSNPNFEANLLLAGAILILAEKVDKLSTSAVTLSQSQTDLTTALNQLGTDIAAAVATIQNGNANDPQVQQAATFIENAASQLQQFDSTVQSALNPTPTPTPTPTSGAGGTTSAAAEVKK